MVTAATLGSLIEYYVNLLIIQYSGPNQPKAQATIALFAQELLASGVFLDVENAYNLIGNDTAVGPQLDVLGKYVGIDRYYSAINLKNYFSFITYSEVASPPSSPPRFGFNTYSTFNNNNYNGTLQYSGIIGIGNTLNDTSFLTLIKLAIIINNSNFSDKQIDNALFEFFGTAVRAEDPGGMNMVFFVNSAFNPLIAAIIAKNLLPVPMAVGASVISNITGPMFAFTTYSGYQSPFGYGFSQYSNYATLSGQVLIYSQILAG